MAVELENVVPLGRSLKEYRLMFDLTDKDLDKQILGVADGIASFNAEMTELGKAVVSVDPIYSFEGKEIKEQFYNAIDSVVDQLRATKEDYVWNIFKSPEEYKQYRIQTLEKFIADYDLGKRERRYIIGELPSLDFEDSSFDLTLCAHLLFFYSEQLDYEFHLASVKEILRTANEVRIFPLLDVKSINRSVHLDSIIRELESEGLSVELRKVDYDMQRGENIMLRIVKEQ
jgi:SAM-dependent methyltransferase